MNNVYIYDAALSGKRHQKLLEQLETRLTDLGLSGKIYRLGPMTRVAEVVRDEVRKKATTIVVVGGDGLVTQVASYLAGTSIPLGIIPAGEEGFCASALGITLENGCRTLAARRIVRLDLGKLDNNRMFLCQASIEAVDPVMALDGGITASAKGPVTIQIVNVLADDYGYLGAPASPEDSKLNIYVLKTENSFLKKAVHQTSLASKAIELEKGVKRITLDNAVTVERVKRIEVMPQSISVIVGKERKF